MTKIVGIYKITTPDNKAYIGQTRNFAHRVRLHKHSTKQIKLKESINQYGRNAHIFDLIHELPNDITQDVLDDYERLYMDQYRECGIELLNLKQGGANGKHCNESIEKMKGKLGKWMIGRSPSDEIIAKIVSKTKGMKRSEETRRRLSESKKGAKNPMFGKNTNNKPKKNV